MIARIWHGYTDKSNANAYETLLKNEIFTGIAKKNIVGYKGIQLLRRELENEVEFITIMWFDTLQAIKDFAGTDYETAVVLPQARALLKRFDAKSQHYEIAHGMFVTV
ncbi:MAG TPA: antibiotic biosynthesis monooxygenase [Chitinophagaceae bacterium]|nr:antibiotic biosynthesis monooxygenase [Chitinophagaceae bacterium]